MPSSRAAKVQLLIDKNAAAGALVERTRAQGVVLGLGTDRLQLEYLPSSAEVKVGDRVVTAGIDGIYPKGFVIGQVESVERSGSEYKDIVVKPGVEFASLEAVLIVLTPPPTVAEATEAAKSSVAKEKKPAVPPPAPPASPTAATDEPSEGR
jgi:rod shape-determining protein MreC